MNQQTIAPLSVPKIAASKSPSNISFLPLSPQTDSLYIFLFSPLFPSCLSSFPFLFFSFLSSTLPTWEDNSPARKMIFLLFNYAAALFPSSLNVDTLSIYIHPDLSFFSLFSFFQTWTEYLSITASKLPFLKKPSPLINLPNPIEAC